MTVSVADIAKDAFDAVAGEVSGVIKTCTLTRTTQGAYNAATGVYAVTTSTDTGRAVFDFSASSASFDDLFPAYVAGPADKLLYVEGLSSLAPREGDGLTVGALSLTVIAAIDVVEAAGLYAVIAR